MLTNTLVPLRRRMSRLHIYLPTLVGAIKQEKALVGAFSVNVKTNGSFVLARYRPSLTIAEDVGLLVAVGGNNESQAATSTVETLQLGLIGGGEGEWVARPEWSIPRGRAGQTDTAVAGYC